MRETDALPLVAALAAGFGAAALAVAAGLGFVVAVFGYTLAGAVVLCAAGRPPAVAGRVSVSPRHGQPPRHDRRSQAERHPARGLRMPSPVPLPVPAGSAERRTFHHG